MGWGYRVPVSGIFNDTDRNFYQVFYSNWAGIKVLPKWGRMQEDNNGVRKGGHSGGNCGCLKSRKYQRSIPVFV